MKVLFAVSNENISNSIIKKYQSAYKEIIYGKNVYYFNAILKELQKDKTYDRIIISEDLEPFSNKNYDTIDNFIFGKLDKISDEACNNSGDDIPIILIANDRRSLGDEILNKLFGIGVYSILLGQDRTIQNLCEMINKPRTKKEAKQYYKIDTNDVDYQSENENNVSETEIQNILLHYKKLGKNEEKYIESFNSIANQYNDQQLKIIVKFLPLGVKAVLEANSPKYQQIATFSGETKSLKNQKPYSSTQINPKTNKPRSSGQSVIDNGIKIESIVDKDAKKLTKPVVIPHSVSRDNVRKINKEVINSKQHETQREIEEVQQNQPNMIEIDDKQETSMANDVKDNTINIEESANVADNIAQPKRGRGRPKKPIDPATLNVPETPKRGRGRPKKIQPQPVEIEETKPDPIDSFEIEENNQTYNNYENPVVEIDSNDENKKEYKENDYLDLDNDQNDIDFENDSDIQENTDFLPGFETMEDDNVLTFDEPELPGFEEIEEEAPQNYYQTNYQDKADQNENGTNELFDQNESNYYSYNNVTASEETQIDNYNNNYQENNNIDNLISSDKKIVAFVGTSKNGTSFLINNIAEMVSRQGIRTAILDLTRNKNSYYIYTKNEENLRKISTECISKLAIGTAQGIPANKNLDIYTSLPGENVEAIKEFQKILTTLAQNYSLILMDCDFETDYNYLRNSQEIYLVQSMDVLTIQPLTAYLRDLKAKNVLEQEKIRIVLNKYTTVRSLTEKTIIGGMAFYNDPSMSFMTELFNRELVKYTIIPFEQQTYSKYLEGLVNCSITLDGYSKEFINSLRKLSNMVYPLVTNNSNNKYNNPKYNKYSTGGFSNQMNNTLDKMKRSF